MELPEERHTLAYHIRWLSRPTHKGRLLDYGFTSLTPWELIALLSTLDGIKAMDGAETLRNNRGQFRDVKYSTLVFSSSLTIHLTRHEF